MPGRLIAFTGRKRSGKDTAAQALIEDGWVHMKFADPIVSFLKALDLSVWHLGCYVKLNPLIDEDYEGLKDTVPEFRRLMKCAGTEGGRHVIGEDVWVNHMEDRLEYALIDHDVVISDARFENEAELVRHFGGTVVGIHRPGRDVTDTHISEAGIPRELVDHEVYNTGTLEDLQSAIRRIARVL